MKDVKDSELYEPLYNNEAEAALLGALLIDPDAFDAIGPLTKADFGHVKYATIFEAMRLLHDNGAPLDYVTVVDKLAEGVAGRDGWGPMEVANLISATPTAMYADHYADLVRRHATLRRELALAQKMAKAVFAADADPVDVARRGIRALEQIALGAEVGEPTDMSAVVNRQFAAISEVAAARERGESIGLHTGWSLDRVTGGFQAGNVVTIAGRPGLGKSSWALAVAMRLAESGHPGAFVSVEMSESEVTGKMLANLSGINSQSLRTGDMTMDEFSSLTVASSALMDYPIHIIDRNCSTVTDIKRHLRRIQIDDGLDFAVIDYVQLLNATEDVGRGENRVQVMSAISRSLKQMAKELGIVVFMVSQLNRGVEQRENKRPLMSDLRESGGLEQDSDVVILLYRDDYYNPESTAPNLIEVSVAKNRHGDTGMRTMHFARETCRFHDVEIGRVELNGPPTPEPLHAHFAPHDDPHYEQMEIGYR